MVVFAKEVTIKEESDTNNARKRENNDFVDILTQFFMLIVSFQKI